MTVATLGIAVDSAPAKTAVANLDALAVSAVKVETSTRRMAATATSSFQGMANAFAGVRDFNTGSLIAYGRELDELRAKYNPLFAAGRQYRETLQEITVAARMGAISEKERASAIAQTKAVFANQVGILNANKEAFAKTGVALGGMSNSLRAVAIQIPDVVQGLAIGQSAFQIMTQQGLQVVQVLAIQPGGIGGALRDIKTALLGLLTPWRLVTVGIAAAGVAAYGLYGLLRREQPTVESSLDEHKRLLGLVKEAYQGAKGAAAQFYDQSKKITELQARQNLINIQEQIRQASRAAITPLTLPSELPEISYATGSDARFATTQYRELNQAIEAFNNSVKDAASVNAFRDAVAAIGLAAQSTNPGLAKQAAEIVKNTTELGKLAKAASETERLLRLIAGQATDDDRKALGLSVQASAYDKLVQSTRERIEILRLEAATAGQASHAVEAYRMQLEFERAAKESGRKVDQERVDALKAEYIEAKKLAEIARLRADIKFERETVSLSPTDQQIAQRLRGAYNTTADALASNEAAQLRQIELLRTARGAMEDFATAMVEGFARGEDMAQVLESALNSLSSQLIRMGSQNLVGGLFSGVGAAGQQTGGLLGGGLTSLLGLGATAAGPVGALAGIGIGAGLSLLGGLFGGNSAKKQAQQQAAQQAAQEAQRRAEEERRRLEQQAETAANYRYQAASLGIDTGTRAGALAKLELDIQRERAEAAKVGGEAITAYEQLAQAKRYALEKEWQDKIAALRLSYEDRIFAALNDTSTLAGKLAEYDRKAAQERADAIKTYGQVYVELEQAQALERGKIIKDAMREQTDYYDNLRRSITDFTNGLSFSNLSALSPAEQYLAARNQFQSQYELALSGDRTAQGGITGVAQTLLEQARNYLGPSSQYGDLVSRITSQLGALPDIAMANDPQVQELQSISASSTQMVDVLTAVRSELEQTRAENRALQQQMARLTADGNQRTETVAEEIGKMRNALVLGLQEIKLRAA